MLWCQTNMCEMLTRMQILLPVPKPLSGLKQLKSGFGLGEAICICVRVSDNFPNTIALQMRSCNKYIEKPLPN